MIIKNQKGDIFEEYFDDVPLNQIYNKFSPITHALILVKYKGEFLLVFDKWKKKWELPGGI